MRVSVKGKTLRDVRDGRSKVMVIASVEYSLGGSVPLYERSRPSGSARYNQEGCMQTIKSVSQALGSPDSQAEIS